jgi:hypothetical protein
MWAASTTPTLPPGTSLSAVWGSAAGDVYAVGRGTIVHWNGSSWSLIDPGTDNDLAGVWGTSASDIWVLGQYDTILHHQ